MPNCSATSRVIHMAQFQTRSTYQFVYDSAKADVAHWFLAEWKDRLARLLSRSSLNEETWAAIDALTDMIGSKGPP